MSRTLSEVQPSAFALTLPQSSIYFDQLRRPASPTYNVGGYLRLENIDPVRLAAAHAALVRDHDVFGLRIASGRDGLLQHVSDVRCEALPLVDFRTHTDPGAAADAWIARQFETPFEVDGRELFRAWLLRVSSTSYRYVGVAHHLLMDGWGFANWSRELAFRYSGSVSPPSTSWSEIAADDADYLNGPRYESDRVFWRERLQQHHARAFGGGRLDRKGRSERLRIALDAACVARIEDSARQLNAGAAHVLLALFALCIGLGVEHEELIVGVPFHNRRSAERRRMLGAFVNMTPLRVAQSSSESTFATLVQEIAREQKACLRHQRYPSSHMAGDGGGSDGMFDVAFNYLVLDRNPPFDDAPAELVYVSHRHEQRALMLTYWAVAGGEGAELQLDYGLAHFDAADAQRFVARLCHLFAALPDLAAQRLDQINLLPEAEQQLLLQGFAEAEVEVDTDVCLHTLFERQVAVTPQAVAVSDGQCRLSYAELNDAANRLARQLIDSGVVPEMPVGIHLSRSIGLPVAVLAVLKAGGSYVPLDSSYPPARIRMLIEDSGLQLALSEDALAPFMRDCGVATLSVAAAIVDNQPMPNPQLAMLDARNRAYVIYTSGSTGKPKGVEICHANAVAFLAWALRTYSREDLARVLACTSLSFDLSVFELFAPLACGGEIVVVRDALELLERNVDVTLVNTVPSAIRMLIDHRRVPGGVRVVNLAGEPLPQRTVNDLLEQRLCDRVYNLYGPSEDTTYSTCALFDRPITEAPSIGRAIAGSRAYVLDAHGRLVPFGAKGELNLAGDGVARGYLGNPELTARKFVRNPFVAGRNERMYKTGDLVRYRADGALEYLGRIDEQVKVRGFRIELGEIRQALQQQPGISGACVLYEENAATGPRLVAFVETGDAASNSSALVASLRQALQNELPSYMVPAAIVVMERLPLMPNGKIDKARLQRLETPLPAIVAPVGETEQRLADIYARVLGIEVMQVSADASLFDLGGHSLLLVRLVNDIDAAFGVMLTLRDLFGVADLRSLARRIDMERDAVDTRRYVETQLLSAEVLSEGTL